MKEGADMVRAASGEHGADKRDERTPSIATFSSLGWNLVYVYASPVFS